MWSIDVIGRSSASPARVYELLSEPDTWSEWNAGVARIVMHGPFASGTTAVMVLPDGTALPFTLAWVEPGRGFEDVTEVPDAGVVVRVRHDLSAKDGGTEILYRCEVDGPDDVAAEVGVAVSSDFHEVIAALAARAEARGV